MKKVKETDELREDYEKSDFPGGLVRGKYAQRLRESSNICDSARKCSHANDLSAKEEANLIWQ